MSRIRVAREEMDKTAKDFAQKITAELGKISARLHDIQNGVLVGKCDSTPRHKNRPDAKNRDSESESLVQNKEPTAPDDHTSCEKYTDSLIKLKPWIELIGVIVVIVYTSYAGCQASLMRKANKLTLQSLQVSQRAYVTVGRKDGVVADFIIPKDPKQKAEIVVYFQNSGHLPAKFAWGTLAPSFLAAGSKKDSTGIKYTHPFKGFSRTRDRKTGSIGEQGESTMIAGDSVLVSTLGEISQEHLAAMPTADMGLFILGMFQYCDGLGNESTMQFGLRYRSNAPASSLSFDLANGDRVPVFPLEATPKMEYLPPCEMLSEKESDEAAGR
jgi:hypothetical protein